MRMKNTAVLIAATLSLLCLTAACEPLPSSGKAIDSMSGQKKLTQQRQKTEAYEAIAAGRAQEAAEHFEKLYLKNNKNREFALNYAQALRKTGKAQRAVVVLAPFVEKKSKIDPVMALEFASASVEIGNDERALAVAEKVLADPKAADLHPNMHNIVGIVLDGQGRHKEAETAYRTALEGWEGDSTSVMNNLALCLVSQGLFDDALTTLRQALVANPNRAEIARNIEIVSDLRKSVLPAPGKKSKPKKE